jgi:hypothetical protein
VQEPQPKPDAGPTKEELDKLAKQAAADAAKEKKEKLPDPAQSFYPGMGVDLNINFLNGGQSDQFEMALGGIHIGLCRFKRLTYCGIGTMFVISAGGKDRADGSKGERFVIVSPLTFSAEKHIGVTIYPYWDPSRSHKSIGVAGGFSLIWKQWGGNLRPQKEKTEVTVTTFDTKPTTTTESKPVGESLADDKAKQVPNQAVASGSEASPPEAKKHSAWVRIFTLGLVR